jgi:hypothetical protein
MVEDITNHFSQSFWDERQPYNALIELEQKYQRQPMRLETFLNTIGEEVLDADEGIMKPLPLYSLSHCINHFKKKFTYSFPLCYLNAPGALQTSLILTQRRCNVRTLSFVISDCWKNSKMLFPWTQSFLIIMIVIFGFLAQNPSFFSPGPSPLPTSALWIHAWPPSM